MITTICYYLLWFSSLPLPTSTHHIEFQPTYQGIPISMDTEGLQHRGQILTIDNFKCYLTNFEFWYQGNLVWAEPNSYYLLDMDEPARMLRSFNLPAALKVDQVKFNLGTDSLTNVSGAMGGDLDPTKGMYWAWNSGYINFKLEGNSPYCQTRKNQFQFHLGGYTTPYSTLQTIVFPFENKSLSISIKLERFLEAIQLEETARVMSPGKVAAQLAPLAAHIFVVSPK